MSKCQLRESIQQLYKMNTFPITDIPEFSKSERIIVVGIVGKSPYNSGIKAKPLNCGFAGDKCQIECSWSENQNVLYLHLSSWFDTKLLLEFVSGLGEENRNFYEASEGVKAAREAGDFLIGAGDITTEVANSLLLIFHLCHIVILSFPTAVFDLSYINLFKAVDTLRLEIKPKVTEILHPIVNADWANQGRPCCPRVLFYFDTCPRQFLKVETSKIKTFEHNLEDQIYQILRKSRIITNISAKSLMAIPKNEEFVYVNNGEITPGNELSFMVKCLIRACETPLEVPEWHKKSSTSRDSLKQFLKTHLDLAFATGFNDNVGKFTAPSLFEVPDAITWSKVAKALTEFLLVSKSDEILSPLWENLSIDTRFSQGRCAKVLPLAQAAYMENLPSHYSTQHHQQRVAVALSVFTSVARGPLADWYRGQLEENCNNIWETRRLCEKLSLTGNPCIKPKHGLDSEESHSSGVRYIAACNCGRTKGSRDDPYTVRIANFEFYSNLGKDCLCGTTSETISFPIFQPSIHDFRAASVKTGPGISTITNNSSGNSPELSQSSQEERLSNVALSETNAERSTNADLSSVDHLTLIALTEANKDKGLVRQPSTTEYLPGMLHTESPPGLLPTFSSWSLVCLGFSSLYSHNIGLPEHLHPGFLPHLNFLVPWDCSVSRLEHWRPTGQQRGGLRGKPFSPLITVKIFFGFEYECPRGHRFMMSAPDEIINGSAIQKDTGAKLASTDMPVYYHCLCRANKPMIAQLTRVHIVSPKAPVHITLDPKVQPIIGGPIFIPGGDCPVKLTGAAYWVLRLPYIYSTERGALPRPTAPLTAATKGKLLQGMIGVTD